MRNQKNQKEKIEKDVHSIAANHYRSVNCSLHIGVHVCSLHCNGSNSPKTTIDRVSIIYTWWHFLWRKMEGNSQLLPLLWMLENDKKSKNRHTFSSIVIEHQIGSWSSQTNDIHNEPVDVQLEDIQEGK